MKERLILRWMIVQHRRLRRCTRTRASCWIFCLVFPEFIRLRLELSMPLLLSHFVADLYRGAPL